MDFPRRERNRKLSEQATFACGFPAEPPKNLVLRFQEGMDFDRLIRLIGHDRTRKQSFDARVSLTNRRLVELNWIEDGQTPVSGADYLRMLELVKPNAEWVAALKKRGIEDVSKVHLEPWVCGLPHPDRRARCGRLRSCASDPKPPWPGRGPGRRQAA